MKPYYQDDAVTIYCGDSMEWLDSSPDLIIHATITDPPYGVNLGNHDGAFETRAGVGLKKQRYDSYDDTEGNLIKIVVPIVRRSLEVSERGLVFCAGNRMWRFPPPDAVSAVYIPSGQGRTCWGFQNLAHFMLYGSAPDLNLGAKNTVLRSNAAAEESDHPCPKPIEWMTFAVSLASRSGETILDPFMGSGTTLRAAKDLGRKAIGIEIEERYCEIAAKRMAQEVFSFK